MFYENLRVLRKAKGMSQEVLAQQLNVVRQTISKWEKGLSVPDADMLTRIADLFEVSVSELLGTKIEEEKNVNEVAAQLALLNEQLASRTRKNRKTLKYIIAVIATALCFCLCVGICIVAVSVPGSTYTAKYETAYITCVVDGEEFSYSITYDDQYQIKETDGDSFITDCIDIEKYSDANNLIAQIQNYFTGIGGDVKISYEK